MVLVCGAQVVNGDIVMFSAQCEKRRSALTQLQEQLQGLPSFLNELYAITANIGKCLYSLFSMCQRNYQGKKALSVCVCLCPQPIWRGSLKKWRAGWFTWKLCALIATNRRFNSTTSAAWRPTEKRRGALCCSIRANQIEREQTWVKNKLAKFVYLKKLTATLITIVVLQERVGFIRW